ncbi:MAG: DNA adenine methylase [Blastocatellia bacterium]|nr:DNA adenine methylase [Blastocatellia bacterium]
MNYIGSKHSLLPFIEEVVRANCRRRPRVVCDLFAGTGAVGRHFKRQGDRVIANDLQYYAFVLNKAYLEIDHPPAFAGLHRAFAAKFAGRDESDPVLRVLAFASGLRRQRGFLARNYSPAGGRGYYSIENAGRADAIRASLERWRRRALITEEEYFYLLCSLLEAIDQVANTASVYGAFLKKFKASALRPLALRPLELTNHVTGCEVHQRDANELIDEIECDLLYLDPPYNHRQYGANYHVLETIAAYDAPALKGVTGMREYPRSRYCRAGEAADALEDLVRKARAKHILLSYNDEGLLSLRQVARILGLRGTPRTFQRDYARFKADNGREYKRSATVEYLHYVRVTSSLGRPNS